jgi:hypothetical protein
VQARATTKNTTDAGDGPSVRQRLRAWIRRDQDEDGVFRPVRLSLAVDLGISAAIIAVVVVTFGAFIVWLAQTQGR